MIGDELKCPDVAWPTLALFVVGAISAHLCTLPPLGGTQIMKGPRRLLLPLCGITHLTGLWRVFACHRITQVAIAGYVLPAALTFSNPGWATVPISAVANYLLFTPMHDAAHR